MLPLKVKKDGAAVGLGFPVLLPLWLEALMKLCMMGGTLSLDKPPPAPAMPLLPTEVSPWRSGLTSESNRIATPPGFIAWFTPAWLARPWKSLLRLLASGTTSVGESAVNTSGLQIAQDSPFWHLQFLPCSTMASLARYWRTHSGGQLP